MVDKSKALYKMNTEKVIEKHCIKCGAIFYTTVPMKNTSKYCEACKHTKKSDIAICITCGKEFKRNNPKSRAKYCCEKCAILGSIKRNYYKKYNKVIPDEILLSKYEHMKSNTKSKDEQLAEMCTKKVIRKNCIICGKEFMTNISAKNRAKYCCNKCRYLGGKKIRKDRIENAMLNEDLDTRLHVNHGHIYGLKENKNIDLLMYRILKKGVELI
jgi:hypothetical protein